MLAFLLPVVAVSAAMTSIAQEVRFDAGSLEGPSTALGNDSLEAELRELQSQLRSRRKQPEELTPPPIDPQRFNNTVVVGAEDFRGAIVLPGTDVALRIDGFARADAIYDTGLVESGVLLFPGLVALDGTPSAAQRGQTTLSARQSRLSFDAQADADIGKLRGFVEMDFLSNDLGPRLRHLFGEWEIGQVTVLGGQTWTTFMDPGALPPAIPETTASGAVFRRPTLFRMTTQRNKCFSWSLAIEESDPLDIRPPDPATDQLLKRWPDAVAQLRWADPELGSLQIASLVRGLGFQDNFGEEHLRTGWGVAITSKLILDERNDIRLGVVGGEGVSGYITGLGGNQSAAGPSIYGFETLESLGAYAAFTRRLTEEFKTTVSYGHAFAESTPLMPAQSLDNVYNAAANLIWSPRPGFGVGVEYYYAMREVRDGTTGDNDRIQFAIQFGP